MQRVFHQFGLGSLTLANYRNYLVSVKSQLDRKQMFVSALSGLLKRELFQSMLAVLTTKK